MARGDKGYRRAKDRAAQANAAGDAAQAKGERGKEKLTRADINATRGSAGERRRRLRLPGRE